MNERSNIYQAPKKSRRSELVSDKIEITPEQIRTRARRKSLGFSLIMLILLGLSVWFIDQQDPMQGKDEPTEAEIMGLLPNTNGPEQVGRAPTPDFTQLLKDVERSDQAAPANIDPERVTRAMDLLRAGAGYLKAHDWVNAEQQVQRALEMWPDMDAALRMQGVIYTQTGRFDEAIALLEQAQRKNPFSPETFNNLATAHMHKGHLQKAEELLFTALRIQPEYHVAELNLGLLYLVQGDFDSAADYLELYLKVHPEDTGVRNNLAVALLRLGLFKEAREHLQIIIDAQPTAPAPYFNMAITYSSEKNFPEALKWMERGTRHCTPMVAQRFLSDRDFDNIRGYPEFQRLLEQSSPIPSAFPNPN